jgi:hypothetical protein
MGPVAQKAYAAQHRSRMQFFMFLGGVTILVAVLVGIKIF